MEHSCDHKGFDREEIVTNIKKYDCHVVMVIGDHLPGFAYSIGLYESFGHPEIICFGMNLNLMGELINETANWIRKDRKIEEYLSYSDFLENVDVKFLPVKKSFYDDYLAFGINYYNGDNFPVMQLVWPDKENKFPWEEDFYKKWKFSQPLLDRNSEFKFYEDSKLGVYTTKQAFEGNPILYVYHNEDSDWQFHTTDYPNFDDARLVCLEEIIKLDPTLNQLYDLKPGWTAFRTNKNEKWERLQDDN